MVSLLNDIGRVKLIFLANAEHASALHNDDVHITGEEPKFFLRLFIFLTLSVTYRKNFLHFTFVS